MEDHNRLDQCSMFLEDEKYTDLLPLLADICKDQKKYMEYTYLSYLSIDFDDISAKDEIKKKLSLECAIDEQEINDVVDQASAMYKKDRALRATSLGYELLEKDEKQKNFKLSTSYFVNI